MALSKSSPHVKSSIILDRDIRMVLIGKTKVGKSATGNTIAGHEVFTEDVWGTEVTECTKHSINRDGYKMQLVDVPGFGDTNMSDEDIRKEMGRCVAMSSPGIHAILFILSIGRFTDEDKKTIDAFIECFGEECRKYVLVIFTEKDKLDKRKKTINEFVRSSPKSLQLFLHSVQDRYMAVDNTAMSLDKEAFTKGLVKQVLQMVQANGGMCYTNSMYRKAEIQLKQAEDEELKTIALDGDEDLTEELRKKHCCQEEYAARKGNEDKSWMDGRRDYRKETPRKKGEKKYYLAKAAGAITLGIVGFCFYGTVGVFAGAATGYGSVMLLQRIF